MNKMTCVTELMQATVILAVSCLYKSHTQNTLTILEGKRQLAPVNYIISYVGSVHWWPISI